jgi:hypothetical protein
MNQLVSFLSENDHPVEISVRPEKSVDAFLRAIEKGYVNIRFTDTRGGTELAVHLDPKLTDIKNVDVANQTGTIRLVGELTLDYIPVRCVADIAIPSLGGKGRLEQR